MYRIEYRSHGFDTVAFADTLPEAERIGAALTKLKHVSAVSVVDNRVGVLDRFVFCARCGFGCRLSQLPESFVMDTNEETNPWVWCPNSENPEGCRYKTLFDADAIKPEEQSA